MTTVSGPIKKMMSALNDVVSYTLPVGEEYIDMNNLIGKTVSFQFLNEIYCIGCGRKTRKSYAQGYCYPCLLNSPETDKCILHPEMCLAHEGISRDMEWSKNYCLQNHIVYISDTTGLKIGVTRESQVPTRWIDQGATRAIMVAKTPNRFTAGNIEVFLKAHFSDRTNWRNMLTNKVSSLPDMQEEKRRAHDITQKEFSSYFIDDDTITFINFPVKAYPDKIKSLTFDRLPVIEGTLEGIKGQYLILDGGKVLNIRKHNGYKISIKF